MKLAITSSEEISDLNKLLVEIESFYKYDLHYKNFESIDFSEYEILNKIEREDPKDFIDGLCKMIHDQHFQRILWNCDVMLKNCADLSLDYLDFNIDIKRGFAGLELLKEIDECLTEENQISDFKKKIKELLTKEKFE